MRLLIVFLLGQVLLDLAHVEQLSRELESKRKVFLEALAVLLQLLRVSIFKFFNFDLIFLLCFLEYCVPVLIKLLVLLDVGLLDLFLALLMREHQLLEVHVVLLLLQLKNAVLSHLSLCTSTVPVS